MSEIDVAALRAAVDKAHDEIVRLCSARENWHMSIPANPEHDSDLIFDEVLSKVPALLDRLAAAEAALERARAAVPSWTERWLMNQGECPRCHHFKFIGHGPLCLECFAESTKPEETR